MRTAAMLALIITSIAELQSDDNGAFQGRIGAGADSLKIGQARNFVLTGPRDGAALEI